jgi:hypothetical protein
MFFLLCQFRKNVAKLALTIVCTENISQNQNMPLIFVHIFIPNLWKTTTQIC